MTVSKTGVVDVCRVVVLPEYMAAIFVPAITNGSTTQLSCPAPSVFSKLPELPKFGGSAKLKLDALVCAVSVVVYAPD